MHIILNVINEILEFKYETYENEKQKTKTVVNRDLVRYIKWCSCLDSTCTSQWMRFFFKYIPFYSKRIAYDW